MVVRSETAGTAFNPGICRERISTQAKGLQFLHPRAQASPGRAKMPPSAQLDSGW
jgi:hypothetical protein